jgi:hypothetical protein
MAVFVRMIRHPSSANTPSERRGPDCSCGNICMVFASVESFEVRGRIPLWEDRMRLPSGSWAGRPGLVWFRLVQGVCASPRWMFAPESAMALTLLLLLGVDLRQLAQEISFGPLSPMFIILSNSISNLSEFHKPYVLPPILLVWVASSLCPSFLIVQVLLECLHLPWLQQ